MSVSETIILGTYGLMLAELIFLPVPSEASAYQLLTSRQAQEARLSEALQQVHGMPVGRKLLVFLLPTSLTVIAFISAFVANFFPQLKDYLLAIPVLERVIAPTAPSPSLFRFLITGDFMINNIN
ncbi:hypothetical protein [Nitrosococcus wardiae]|uniref:hypothetical protein n=1 Tax=Nitrosococcus wardiae TaxID=1814290 RepID=UPI0019817401|nr:hypothetical protein [Nitrosococcus wardiae]